MRLRPVFLALSLASCASGDDNGFTGRGTVPDETVGGTAATAPGTSSSGGVDTSTGEASTGAPEPTTGPVSGEPITGTTGLDPSTGVTTETGTSEATGGSDDTGDPTGPPADCPRVRITTPNDYANVRPDPSTVNTPVGMLSNGVLIDVVTIVEGELVDGVSQWVLVKSDTITGYVWAGIAVCTMDEPSTDGFFLPLPCGMTATVSQGNNGEFSHNGNSAWAFDFSLGSGTPLVAIADGTVSHAVADTKPGDPCYNGGGQECDSAANFVTILHGDGYSSIYGHLSEVQVSVGQAITRGSVVGLSGSTGWSTGRHAHVARQESCAYGWCQSIPTKFTDVPGDGVPVTDQSVTSGNCP